MLKSKQKAWLHLHFYAYSGGKSQIQRQINKPFIFQILEDMLVIMQQMIPSDISTFNYFLPPSHKRVEIRHNASSNTSQIWVSFYFFTLKKHFKEWFKTREQEQIQILVKFQSFWFNSSNHERYSQPDVWFRKTDTVTLPSSNCFHASQARVFPHNKQLIFSVSLSLAIRNKSQVI